MGVTSMKQGRVLAVDDEPRNLAIVEELLEDFEVATAKNGDEAFEKIAKFRPDLVLLDVMMPGMDGYEVCHRIRQDEESCFVKVIFVSGKSSIEERLHGYEVGGDDYVAKPFDVDELLAKVNVFLRLKHVEEVDEMKSTLITLLAHETRTPLTGIVGYSSLLASTPGLTEEDVKKQARAIHGCAERLQKLVDQAGLLANLKAKGQLELFEYTLASVLGPALQRVEGLAADAGVTIEQDVVDVSLLCNPTLMHKVPLYIIENAVQHSPQGGRVKVRAVVTESGNFELTISDEGKGISAEALEHIGDEFSVGDLDHHSNGRGLSLAIARRVVDLHGGTLSVESVVGQGTTFRIELPVGTCVLTESSSAP